MGEFKVILPFEATNEMLNPALRSSDLGSYNNGTGGTVARSFARAMIGNYSLLVNTGSAANPLMSVDNDGTDWDFGAQGDTVWFSVWVWVSGPKSSGGAFEWNGGDLYLRALLTNSSHEDVSIWQAGVSPKDCWFPLITKVTLGSDQVGKFALYSDTASSSDQIYMDGFQWTNTTRLQTYIDGEEEGCEWDGVPDDSTSTRSLTRAGGEVVDLYDDLGLAIEISGGTGFPEIENMLRDRALTDGMEFVRTRVRASRFALNSIVTSDSLNNYHAERKALIEALRPSSNGGAEPVWIEYWGARDSSGHKKIQVRLAGGFQQTKQPGFTERMNVMLDAAEPYWESIHQQSQNLFTESAPAGGYGGILMSLENGGWSTLGLTATSHTTVNDIYDLLYDERDNVLYVAGDFDGWNNASLTNANNFVKYNFTTAQWERCGGASAVNNTVWGLAIRPEGGVYLCGNFTALGASSHTGVAYYEHSSDTFGNLGDNFGVTNVREIVVGKSGDLFCVGPFLAAGGDPDADGLCRYNFSTSTWEDIPGVGSFSLQTYAIAVAPNGDLYVGGSWNRFVESTTCYNIIRIENPSGTATQRKMGNGVGAGSETVEYIYVDDNGDVYAIGGYTEYDSIAKWNGSEWIALGSGLGGLTYQAVRVGSDIIVSGYLGNPPTAGGLELPSKVAAWDGSSWKPLDVKDNLTTQAAQSIENVKGQIVYAVDATPALHEGAIGNTVIIPLSSAKSYPRFTIDAGSWTAAAATMTLWSIKNLTTGAELTFNYEFVRNEILEIDLRPGQRSMVSSIFGNKWDILASSDVANFYLEPGVDNRISVYIESTGAPTPSPFMHMHWSSSHWGID